MKIGRGVTLLIGGARSGKSDVAVKLGTAWDGDVTFAATAEPLDADMANRIERHQLDRPAEWETVEHPLFGAAHVSAVSPSAMLIVDCVTLLVSNLMLGEHPISPHVQALGEALAERPGPTIVVTNEVGMGVHPETELGRAYRDELGKANRLMAGHSETTLLIVAGRGIPLESVTW